MPRRSAPDSIWSMHQKSLLVSIEAIGWGGRFGFPHPPAIKRNNGSRHGITVRLVSPGIKGDSSLTRFFAWFIIWHEFDVCFAGAPKSFYVPSLLRHSSRRDFTNFPI